MDTLDAVIGGGRRAESGPSYAEALTAFLDRLNVAAAEWCGERFKNLEPPTHMVAGRGRKYDRVARVEKGQGRSVVYFVEKGSGTIWKPDGWKGPVLNFPRGNIFDLPERPAGARADPILHLC